MPVFLKLQLIKSKMMQRGKNDPKFFLYLLVVNTCKTLNINSSLFYSIAFKIVRENKESMVGIEVDSSLLTKLMTLLSS